MLLAAKASDASFGTSGQRMVVSIEPEEISILEYKEMLMATVKAAIEILGYGSAQKIESQIFGIAQKPKRKGLGINKSIL